MSKVTFSPDGCREIDFILDDESTQQLQLQWKNFLTKIQPYPNNFSGKGIVTCAGGDRYLCCAWVMISKLRKLGCQLPIHLWYYGDELSEEIIELLEGYDVQCYNFLDYGYSYLSGFMLKPAAILQSPFKDVLFLDSDNNCLADPTYLFSTAEYLEFGAIFWPDYWRTCSENPIWKIVESTNFNQFEQDSGQIMINKEKFWLELNLTLHFNINHFYYYKFLMGDKDTFKFAWEALNTKFYMIQINPGSCGYLNKKGQYVGHTMVQYGLKNEMLFLHRNLLKWDVTFAGESTWEIVKEFTSNPMNKQFTQIKYSNTHNYLDLNGDVSISDFKKLFPDYENSCLEILETFRTSHIYSRFLSFLHINKYRYQ